LTKAQATKVAQMAHNGLARTISPAHTSRDGDTIFAASLGEERVPTDVVGTLAIEAVMAAVVRGITQARSADGLPAHERLFG
jgi:L-aminopeptidase/D-esterase-like protein